MNQANYFTYCQIRIKMWVTSWRHQKWNLDWHQVPKTWWRVAQNWEKEGIKRGRTMETTKSWAPSPSCLPLITTTTKQAVQWQRINTIIPLSEQSSLQPQKMGAFTKPTLQMRKLEQLSRWEVKMPIQFIRNTDRTRTQVYQTPRYLDLSKLWPLACFLYVWPRSYKWFLQY